MISVIVPVYNAVDLLQRCVDSLELQTYKNLEVLLIDDGSTDGSSLLCDEYANKYPNVKVYHKKNGGNSSARNYGIEHAKGDWLYFCDDDDYVYPHALEQLAQDSMGCYGSIGGYELCDVDGNLITKMRGGHKQIIPAYTFVKWFLHHPFYKDLGAVWIKLFRRDVIEKYRIRFREDILTAEDFIFTVDYFCHCEGDVSFNSDVIYKHYNNTTSFSRKFGKEYDQKSASFLPAWITIKRIICQSDCAWGTKLLSRLVLIRHFNLLLGVLYRTDSFSISKKKEVEKELTAQLSKEVSKVDLVLYRMRELAKLIYLHIHH